MDELSTIKLFPTYIQVVSKTRTAYYPLAAFSGFIFDDEGQMGTTTLMGLAERTYILGRFQSCHRQTIEDDLTTVLSKTVKSSEKNVLEEALAEALKNASKRR